VKFPKGVANDSIDRSLPQIRLTTAHDLALNDLISNDLDLNNLGLN